MRSRSGTIRSITAEHRFEKLREFSAIDFERDEPFPERLYETR